MKIVATIFILVVLGMVNRPVRGAETNDIPQVGQLREFSHFTFEGNNTFSARSLWFGLNSTFDFPELSHPLAPRDAFLTAIESHLRLGYAHCGFPDAEITAKCDANADAVIVHIVEGPRYLCGPVEIIGARKVPTQPLVQALTITNADTQALRQPFQFQDNAPANRNEVTETNNSSIWAAGLPAHFDEFSLRFLSGRVTNTLEKLGFFLAKFKVQVVTNSEDQTATLQVKILEEGPPATIESIKVTGNRKNSREALLNYLSLKRGMKFTSDLAADINNRLYHSARFLTNSVQAGTPDSSGRLKLTIEVLENDRSPPLTGKFEPVEKAMLKARDWLAKLGDSQEEAVFSASGYSKDPMSVQFILAPHKGLLILENELVSGTNRLRHALVASSSQIALYVPRLQQKYVTAVSSKQFASFVTVETGAPGADGNTANLSIGAGLANLENVVGTPPYALRMSLAPAAFVRLAHLENETSRFEGDQLICSNADLYLRLDAKTGRFIEYTHKTGESAHSQMNLHFETQAFELALARIEHNGAGFTNAGRTNAPFGSAIAFFGSELVQLPFVGSYLRAMLPAATCEQLPALLQRLGTEDFLAPFEIFKPLQAATDNPANRFEIPEESRPVHGGIMGTEIAAMAQVVLAGTDLGFQPQSWPWIVLRDVAFFSRGQQTYLKPDMAVIYGSNETGPIGYLATAELLQLIGAPDSKNMAKRGLQKLSLDAFRKDYHLLLDEHYVAGKFFARLAAVLAKLDEPQLDALTAPMNASQAEFIRDCAQRLHATNTDQSLADTIAPALDVYWEKDLKHNITVQLKKIAKE